VDLDVDFEIGPSLDRTQEWDGSMQELYRIMKEGLEFQRDQLKYDVDVDDAMYQIFNPDITPEYLCEQARNGYFMQAEEFGYLD